MPAQRVHAAAGHTDIAEQELHHRTGADHLRTDRMLRPAERVHDGHRAIRRRSRGDHVPDLQHLVLRRAADAFDHLRRVARVVLLEQVVDAARIGQGRISLDVAIVAARVVPTRLVVAALVRVVARVDAVVEREFVLHDERQVGVVDDVVALNLVLQQQVVDQSAEENDISARADRRIDVGERSRAREARIDDDQFRLVVRLRLGDPLESARMRFGGVATHDENEVGILDVDPVIRHRTSAKRRGKTCHRRAVSDTCLVIERQ